MSDVTTDTASAAETETPGTTTPSAAPTAEVPASPPAAPGAPPPGQGPPTAPGWAGWATPAPAPQQRGGVFRSVAFAWLVAGMLALAVVGLAVALGLSGSSNVRVITPFPGPRQPVLPTPSPSLPGVSFGVAGTVATVGNGTFVVTALSGQTVTVNEQSSTTYMSGGSAATSAVVVPGVHVLVEGTRTGNTVTATRVIVFGGASFGGGF